MTAKTCLIAAATVIGALFVVAPATADDEYNVSTGTTLTGAGVALRGDDVVALATGLNTVPGYARFTVERDGVAYYFSSEETMALFAANPDAYLPQYGGFCAFGVAINMKLDANPRFADIVDGKLYVFLNEAAWGKYVADKEGTLAKAEANWPAMQHLPVEDVNAAANAS